MNSLDKTIENHFSAIKNRDLKALLTTVDSNNITLILPNGQYSNTISQYKEVNNGWFSDQDWKIEYEVIEKITKSDLATVLTKITYYDIDENDKPYSFQYYLTLIFELQKEEWKLVFDQNTIIK